MKLNDEMNLKPARNQKLAPARALVAGVSDDGTQVRLMLRNPPEWFLADERSHGLFAGEDYERIVFLFKDHAGTWTDTANMKQFTLEDA